MDKEKMVQGVGLYGEFVSPQGAVYQVILTPDGYDLSDQFVPANLMSRTITKYSPKKQWRMRPVRGSGLSSEDLEMGLIKLSFDFDAVEVESYAWNRLEYFTGMLKNLADLEYKLRKQPILIEVSKKDLDAVSKRNTPTKVIYRIGQSRDALGFPKDLFDSVGV